MPNINIDTLRRQILDLKVDRARQWDAALEAHEANNKPAYDAAMAEVDKLDASIAEKQALVDKYVTPDPDTVRGNTPGGAHNTNLTEMRSSNEYVRTFCDAIRNGITRRDARRSADYHILTDALTEGTDTDGGFLVPVDLQTRINELRRQFVSLRNLITVEPVTTLTGYRVLDTAPTKGFTKLSEMGDIPQDDQPAFSRYDFKVEDYGLIVPISNDLLRDNDAGLLQYLARWMAKKAVITENMAILGILAAIESSTTLEAGQEIVGLKKALNVTLDPDIALRARILTNQTSYDVMDNIEDNQGRPMMQPDITAGTGYRFKGKPITAIGNSFLKDDETGSPLYVGSFADAITMFDRQVMELATTNVGGKAWSTNSTEARAIMRMQMKQVDKEAVVAMKLAAGKNSGVGG